MQYFKGISATVLLYSLKKCKYIDGVVNEELHELHDLRNISMTI